MWIQPFLMEKDCGGGQGLSWAVEPRKEEEGISHKYLKQAYFLEHRSNYTVLAQVFLMPWHVQRTVWKHSKIRVLWWMEAARFSETLVYNPGTTRRHNAENTRIVSSPLWKLQISNWMIDIRLSINFRHVMCKVIFSELSLNSNLSVQIYY